MHATNLVPLVINVIPLADLTARDLALAGVLSMVLTGTCLALLLGGPRFLARRAPAGRAATRPGAAPLRAGFRFRGDRLQEAPVRWLDLRDDAAPADDWLYLRGLLSQRFPGLPDRPDLPDGGPVRLVAETPDDPATLRMQRHEDGVALELHETRPPDLADRYVALRAGRDASALRDQIEHLPIAVWTMDDTGRILSANDAFRQVEEQITASDEALAPLLRGDDRADERPVFTFRATLPARDRHREAWIDITARRRGGTWECAAQDVSALVKAEMAQRNFVQTLTKTFAQLSTGLAIFDRDRQLILFNPALVDLTQMSPEFLTSRPALSQFFDYLRDRQIMPEPKNYASWREQLNELVSAAADGRYHETWSLASGATYRVTGRPHPNGAVAFLFEDITDHISMTRRFRQQLSLSQSVLDAFSDAIAIFDSEGMMSHCNRAYRELFRIPEDADLVEISTTDAHRMWTEQALSPTGLDDVFSRLVARRGRTASRHRLMLRGLGKGCCTVMPLIGGARMITISAARRDLPMLEGASRESGGD